MEPVVTGALIGAGAQLLGGLFGGKSSNKIARQELAQQREFAQKGIQWRVEDAKAAGLHPLFALGAQTPSYTPSQTVGAGEHMGRALAQAGQGIGNAVARQQTPEQRNLADLQLKLLQAQVNSEDERAFGMFLDNARKVQALEPGNSPGNSIDPRFIYGGSGTPGGGVGQVSVKPSEVVSSSPGDPSMEAGIGTFWKNWRIDKHGRTAPLPSKDVSELLEAIGESPMLGLAILNKIEQQNPQFLLEQRDVMPFADALYMLRRGTEAARDKVSAMEDDPRLRFGPGEFGRIKGGTRQPLWNVLRRYPQVRR